MTTNTRNKIAAVCTAVLLGIALIPLTACKPSPYVQMTVTNASGDTVQQLQVDYPSASFGKDRLADGAGFNYRFKIQGEAKLHIEFLDSKGKQYQADGPELNDGQQGTVGVRIAPGFTVSWQPALR